MAKKCQRCVTPPTLNDRVTIEKPDPAATAGASGNVDLDDDDNWVEVATRSASVKTPGGNEAQSLQQVQAFVYRTIEMRSDSTTRSIIPTWRLRLDGKKLNIRTAYDVDNARQWVRVETQEAV
jgi:head-tail adaptor